MKFKDGVILTQNGEENILVTSGEAGDAFSGMIKPIYNFLGLGFA